MPARRGGFGGGLNPFGGGQLGSLAQYDIGKDLADLAVYQTEVAWGNGQATDAEYVDALRRAAAAADPNTQGYYSAQNKVDDAVYRIGRSVAEGQGLDALIAFDQAALATMSPDNLRYRDILDSVQSEMAQRRSRDYGELVDALTGVGAQDGSGAGEARALSGTGVCPTIGSCWSYGDE